MSVIGLALDTDQLVLTTGRDFSWTFQCVDLEGVPQPFPAGELYFEFELEPLTVWKFVIDGSIATIKVEHVEADLIPNRTRWQLVFQAAGEAAGGAPVARGNVRVQQ